MNFSVNNYFKQLPLIESGAVLQQPPHSNKYTEQFMGQGLQAVDQYNNGLSVSQSHLHHQTNSLFSSTNINQEIQYLHAVGSRLNEQGIELFLELYKEVFNLDTLELDADTVDIQALINSLNLYNADLVRDFVVQLNQSLYSKPDLTEQFAKLNNLESTDQKIFIESIQKYTGLSQELTYEEALNVFMNLSDINKSQLFGNLEKQIDFENVKNLTETKKDTTTALTMNNLPLTHWDEALNLPNALGNVFMPTNFLEGFGTSLGDFTFLTKLHSLKTKANIYNLSQRISSAVGVLNSQDLKPNAGFDYLNLGKSYSEYSPSEKESADKIFTQMKRDALTNLEQIAARLQEESKSIDSLTSMAEGHKSYQDGIVQSAIQSQGGGR